MNGHLGPMLDAYLDGELENGRKRRAEAHLDGCAACRAELARRRSLSALLGAATAPAGGKSGQRFAAEVGLRLGRRKPAWRPTVRPASLGMAIPVALLLAWAFVQAAAVVAGAVELIPGAADALRGGLAAAVPQFRLPETVRDALQWIAPPGPGVWDGAVFLFALFGIGLLFTGWLAGWWISRRSAGSNR